MHKQVTNMAAEIMKLIAPNSLPITGIKLANGSTSDFEYSYDVHTRTSMYIVPPGTAATVCSPTVLIDSAGNEWDGVDVEFHSLMKSR